MTTQTLVSTREAAEVIGVHPRTILRMVDRGVMYPFAHIERGRRGTFVFDPAEVERVRDLRAQLKGTAK